MLVRHLIGSLFDRKIDLTPRPEYGFDPSKVSPPSSHPSAATAERLNTPATVISPPTIPRSNLQQCATKRSKLQDAEALRIAAEHKAQIEKLFFTGNDDGVNANKDERALQWLVHIRAMNPNGWVRMSDRELADLPEFNVHASTVSRWRKQWLTDGVIEVKRVKRRVWMRSVVEPKARPL